MEVPFTCQTCGHVTVDATLVEAHVNRSDGFHLLTTVCPVCGDILGAQDPRRLDALIAAGARRCELLPPAPPFTADDLLDLHRALDDGNWLAGLLPDAP